MVLLDIMDTMSACSRAPAQRDGAAPIANCRYAPPCAHTHDTGSFAGAAGPGACLSLYMGITVMSVFHSVITARRARDPSQTSSKQHPGMPLDTHRSCAMLACDGRRPAAVIPRPGSSVRRCSPLQ